MTRLATSYLGLPLKNPLVVAACPLTHTLAQIRPFLETSADDQTGVGAVVMHSVFQEQFPGPLDRRLCRQSENQALAASYFPSAAGFVHTPERYLEALRALKRATRVPVIASMDGITPGPWADFARDLQQAGADAIELNLYFLSTDPLVNARELERNFIYLVRQMRGEIAIPLAVKLHPFFSAMPNLASELVDAGVQGLALFSRFCQPNLDLDTMGDTIAIELSTGADLLLPLRWASILHGRVRADLMVTGGVHTTEDVVRSLLAGANCVGIASEFIRQGPKRVGELLAGLDGWLDRQGHAALAPIRGRLSQQHVAEPAAFERAQYIKTLQRRARSA